MVGAASFPSTVWSTHFTKILLIRNLIQFVGSVYVLMNLIMLLLMCYLSCPVKSSNRVTQLVKASCRQMVLCWKRSSQCPIKQSPRSKARACMLFMLILSRQIVVSALCRNLVSYPLFLQQKLFWILIVLKTELEIDSLKLSVSEASAFGVLSILRMKFWPFPVICSLFCCQERVLKIFIFN